MLSTLFFEVNFLIFLAVLLGLIAFRLFFERKRIKALPGGYGLILPDMLASFRLSSFYLKEKQAKYGPRYNAIYLGLPAVVIGANSEDIEWFKWGEKNHGFVSGWPSHIERLLGKGGIVLTVGAEHKRVRNIVIAALLPRAIRSHVPLIDQVAKKALTSVNNFQSTVALSKWVTLHVFFEVAGFDTDEDYLQEITNLLGVWARGLGGLPIAIPGGRLARGLQARKKLLELITTRELTKQPRENSLLHRLRSSEGIPSATDGSDEALSDDELLNNLLVIEFAGQDTTSVLISSAICHLATPKNRQILEKLQQDIAATFPEDRDFVVDDYETILGIDFLWAIFSETARIGAPVSVIFRKVGPNGAELPGGLALKPSTSVVWDLMSKHFSDEIFPDPMNFHPERWLIRQEDGSWARNKQLRDQYLNSFGGGERLCPGRMLAEIEFFIFLIRLVGRPGNTLELDGPPTPVHFPMRGTVGTFRRNNANITVS